MLTSWASTPTTHNPSQSAIQPSTSPSCHYIKPPRRMINELSDNPRAIALYTLIARLYASLQTPVPLSRDDIQKYIDPSANTRTIKDAFDRLLNTGWLIKETGYKGGYIPTWGTDKGSTTPIPWKLGAQRLGCPERRWRDAPRIDSNLFDIFIGKFEPLKRNAYISSYFVDEAGRPIPLLSLLDIGFYILAKADIPITPTPALEGWGLLSQGQAQDIPDVLVVLALASQRAHCGIQLSKLGWSKLGWRQPPTSQPIPGGGAIPVPLIFVSKEQVGSLIPQLIPQPIPQPITQTPPNDTANTAIESLKSDNANNSETSAWNLMENMEIMENMDSPPTPPTNNYIRMEGEDVHGEKENRTEEQSEDYTEIKKMLQDAVVHQASRLVKIITDKGLSAQDVLPKVRHVIAVSKASRLSGGWIYTTLVEHFQEQEPLPILPKSHRFDDCINVEETRRQHPDLFPQHTAPIHEADTRGDIEIRESRDVDVLLDPTTKLRELANNFDKRYRPLIRRVHVRVFASKMVIFCASVDDRLELESIRSALTQQIIEMGLPSDLDIRDQTPPDVSHHTERSAPQDTSNSMDSASISPAPVALSPLPDGDITTVVQYILREQCNAYYHPVIDGLTIHITNETTIVQYASTRDMIMTKDVLRRVLTPTIATLGLPSKQKITDKAPDLDAVLLPQSTPLSA